MCPLNLLFLLVKISNSCQIALNCNDLEFCEKVNCTSKSLFPMNSAEIIGGFFIFLVSIIANAGGIGGSSIIITIMITFFEFSAQEAVKFAQVSIFAGVFTVIIFKIQDRHPNNKRPLIYYDFLLLIISPVLIGVNFGVMIKPALPDWAILGLLSLIMCYLFSNIVHKAMTIHKKENQELNTKENQSLLNGGDGDDNIAINLNMEKTQKFANIENMESIKNGQINFNSNNNNENDSRNTEKESFLPETKNSGKILSLIELSESEIIPRFHLLYFIFIVVVSALFVALKNEKLSISFTKCSSEYFFVIFSYTLLMLTCTIFSSIYLIKKFNVYCEANYEFEHDDLKWSYCTCFYISLFGIFCGLITGMLGGGNLMSPFLLGLGIRPEVSTVTSSFLILISTANASQFLITGDSEESFLIYFAALSVTGSFIGTQFLRKYAIQRKRVSYLVICTAIVFFITLVCVPVIGIRDILQQMDDGKFKIGINSIC